MFAADLLPQLITVFTSPVEQRIAYGNSNPGSGQQSPLADRQVQIARLLSEARSLAC